MESDKKLAIIDIGNSFFKIKFGETIYFFDNSKDNLDDFSIFLKEMKICKVIISFVNTEKMQKIITVLNLNKIEYQMVNSILKTQKIIDFSEISGMGDDRKLGLIGATYFTEPPLITIDCGTAITVNILDKNYKSLGGAILLGMETQTKALNYYTSLLPKIEITNSNYFIGKNTEDSLKIGVLASISGGICEIIASAIDENSFSNLQILFTGGNGALIKELCNEKIKNLFKIVQNIDYYPNLVINGIEKLIFY